MTENDNIQVPANDRRVPLGLALSGGGSRGLAHAGALKAMEEAGLRPDIIAGVSAGSIVAVMYSAGLTPEQILEHFCKARFSELTEFKIGKGGFMKIDRFGHFLERKINGYTRLEDLPIPTYVGVTNFEAGQAEEFHSGDIRQIVMASCSIPIAIRPVVIDGVTYVDGGVLRNLPAWIIRDKCRKLIGVNVSPRIDGKVKDSFFAVALRTYNLLAKSNQQQDMDMCDLVVQTRSISHHRVFSLKDLETVYRAGYDEMKAALSQRKDLTGEADPGPVAPADAATPQQ